MFAANKVMLAIGGQRAITEHGVWQQRATRRREGCGEEEWRDDQARRLRGACHMKWKWGTTLRRRASVCIWLPGVYQAVCVSGCCGSAAGLVHVREVTGQGLQNGREGREQLGSEESALLSAINQSNSTTSRSLTSTNPGHQRRYKIPR
ncbi:hypothetical protein PC121_g5315 [Phytophthora cactorum]|nr:hypothetical protein PC120_g2487 [Phytophthora cactorum]KAG3084813.1 hypothetical protein PC121_g5315 [Phytophthora cactorum]